MIMKLENIYDYRNADGILEHRAPAILEEISSILNDQSKSLILGPRKGKQQDISAQIQNYFTQLNWQKEKPLFSFPSLRYDLLKNNIPIEIEIGHERLVYAVFFKFLADYSNEFIPAGIMIVTDNPTDLGHTWHNSLESTKKKIEAIKKFLLVPILVMSIKP